MSPPTARPLRVAGVVVAALLVALALYPGSFAAPYVAAGPAYDHTIVPESSPLYDDYTEGYDREVYQYEALSPVAQDLFDRTRAAEPREQYNGERRYRPDVCREFMLVCDSYAESEMPAVFTYGTELSYAEAFVVVEDGEERYLLRTGTTGHLFLAPFPTGVVLSWVTLLPLAAAVAVAAVRGDDDRVLGGLVAGGALVGALGVVAPYVAFAGLAPAWVVGTVALAGVWVGLLAGGGRRAYRRIAAGGSGSSAEND